MTSEKSDFRSTLRELLEEDHRNLGEHPAPKTLDRYLRKALSDEATSRVRRHLILCPECTQLLLWLEGPALTDSENLEEVSAEETDGAWARLRAEVDSVTPDALSTKQEERLHSRSWEIPQTLAALLALTVLALGAWVWSLRSENRALSVSLTGSPGLSINTPVLSLRPRDTVRDASSPASATEIPEGHPIYVFILNFREERPHSDYLVRLLSREGEVVSRSLGLEKTNRGNVSMTIRRELLPDDGFQLEIHGLSQGQSELLSSYEVRFGGVEP